MELCSTKQSSTEAERPCGCALWRVTCAVEAEVGRFEPLRWLRFAFAMKNNKAGENPTPPRPRPHILAARRMGLARPNPQKRQGKCGRGGRGVRGGNSAPPALRRAMRGATALGTRFRRFAERGRFELPRSLRPCRISSAVPSTTQPPFRA